MTWHSAQPGRQVVSKAREIVSLTSSYCWGWCKHVPKDDFVWIYVEDGAHSKKKEAIRMVGTWCATCGKTYNFYWVCGCHAARRECQRQRGLHGRYADTKSPECHASCSGPTANLAKSWSCFIEEEGLYKSTSVEKSSVTIKVVKD